ncbi:MAG: hypothetical protein IPP42_06230 [Saprospiraceae bacterium]|nr:hypothetical protein [Saprospiraceae bacterium]
MNEEEIDDIIERYVLNTMAPDERIAFESELKVHPEWKEKIRFHDLLLSLLNSESKSFKNAVHSAKLIQSKNAKYNYPKIIAVFLSLLFLTLIFNKSFYSNRQPTLNDKIKSNIPLDDSILKSSDSIDRFDNAAKASQMKSKMYELYAFKNIHDFKKEEITFRYLDTIDNVVGIIDKAIDAYSKNDFEYAIHLSKELSETDSFYLISRKILGLSLFKIKRYTEAANQFKSLLNNSDLNTDEIEWNLLMITMVQLPDEKLSFKKYQARF